MPTRPSVRFAAHRDAVRQLAAKHRTLTPRVFGSVARGEGTETSDLDLLVDVTDGTSLFDLAALELALEALLGVAVHVTTSEVLKGDLRDRVLREAAAV